MLRDLEERLEDQRSDRQILVLANKIAIFRLPRQRLELKDEDKLRVNLKYLAYYILLQIVYIDNICEIYKVLKVKNKKYLVRQYQILDE